MKTNKTATDLAGYEIRPVTPADLKDVLALAAAYDISVIGEPDVDESDFSDTWQNPRTTLGNDTWVATDPTGEIVAYEHCVDPAGNGRLEIEGFVHPDHKSRGIGSALMALALERARELAPGLPPDSRRFVRLGTFANDPVAHTLMEDSGFTHVRYFLRMTIRLESAPADCPPPDGITIRALTDEESFEGIHAACDEIFRDHWGNTPISYDSWVTLRTGGAHFDRSLWFLALAASGELAGISLCSNYGDTGWVETLGVRRGYRGMGLGKALLLHSFAACHSRGQKRIGLGVDADSLTGATRLYESAGMKADVTVDVWDKEL